jgi:hypothetical protein
MHQSSRSPGRPGRWLGLLGLLALLALFIPDSSAPAQKDKEDEKLPALSARDLSLLSRGGGGYVCLSPGALLDHPLLKRTPVRFRESLQALEREMPARTGVRLRQLERVTLAFPVGGMSGPISLLTASKEVDGPTLAGVLGGDWKQAPVANHTAFRNPRVTDAIVLFNSNLLMIGTPRDIEAFLEQTERSRTDATLHTGLASAEAGAPLVVGVRPDDLAGMFPLHRSGSHSPPTMKAAVDKDASREKKDASREKDHQPPPPPPPGHQPVAFQGEPGPSLADLLKELPIEALPYKPLLLCKSATFTVRLGEDDVQLALRLSYARPELAEDGSAAVKTTLYVLREALPRWWVGEIGLKKESAVEVIRALDRLVAGLQKTTVEVSGRRVLATTTLPLDAPLLGALLREMDFSLPVAAERSNALKQIGLALHSYHDVFGVLPGTAYYSAQGKPLLSWRVAILPFIEEDNLFKQFKLDEPWDSAHNIKLLEKMPKTFAPPPGVKAEPGHTFIQGFSGPGTIFDPERDKKQPGQCGGIRLLDILDGTSNTAMVGESGKSVPWTKPEDIPATGQTVPPLGSIPGSDRCLILMGDGSVQTITNRPPLEAFRILTGRADGQVLDLDSLKPGRARP